jgi:hypothetical protein
MQYFDTRFHAHSLMCVLLHAAVGSWTKKVKLALCIINYGVLHEDVGGSGYIDPRIQLQH